MTAVVLPIGPGLTFKSGISTHKVSDHNRSELSILPERIEYKKRMADGTLRSFVVVSQKRIFKVSWSKLPKNDNQTIDGFWGALSLQSFHASTIGSFELIQTYGDNVPQSSVFVMYEDFSFKLTKRSVYTDFYDIDMSLKEV